MRTLNQSELAHVSGGANPHLTTVSVTTTQAES
jgi:bacteriocin-like protein